MIWRRAKYVGIHPPTWEIAAALANCRIFRWITTMRVKELLSFSLQLCSFCYLPRQRTWGLISSALRRGIGSMCIRESETTNPVIFFLE